MEHARTGYHHGDLRAALVTAARGLLVAGGEGFSLREAARLVGVSANAAYRHFDDKAALLTAVAADGFSRLAQEMTVAVASPTSASAAFSQRAKSFRGLERSQTRALHRFRAVGRAYVAFARREPAVFRLMFGAEGLPRLRPSPRGVAASSSSRLPEVTPYVLLENALDELVEVGLLPPSRRSFAATHAWSVVHGYASLSLDLGLGRAPSSPDDTAHDGGAAGDPALEALLDFTILGLCSEGVVASARPRKAREGREDG
jgi:AcrR family transcriptional regulator